MPGPGLGLAQLAPQQVCDHEALQLGGVAAGLPEVAATTGLGHGAGGLNPAGILRDPAGDPALAMAGLPLDLSLHKFAGEEGQGSFQEQQTAILGATQYFAAPSQSVNVAAPGFSLGWGIPICWRHRNLRLASHHFLGACFRLALHRRHPP